MDGVLYSCDFSNKTLVESENKTSPSQSPAPEGQGPSLSTRFRWGRAGARARARLEAARRILREQAEAQRALEAALSLAKQVGKEEGGSETSSKRTTYNSSVVSIPLAMSRHKKLSSSSCAGSQGRESSSATSKSLQMNDASSSQPDNPNRTPQKESYWDKRDGGSSGSPELPPAPSIPCLCKHSTSSLVGANRKGWEGTATLYHGSRLRFGCLQFVFSIAGRPGHSELVEALSHLLSEHDL